jgi:hypothetical protein
MREASPWRKKGEDDTSWGDANLTGPKNEESPRGRFSYYKFYVNSHANKMLEK